MRSGRFDKKIYLGPPDFEARKELFKIFIEKTSRPHDVLDYDVLAELTQDYVSADIQAICDEAARDASNSILDIMKLLQEDFEKHDIAKLKEDISKNLINMQLLEQAIIDTPSSLKMVDMSVYQDWLKTLES
jgi:transitional endoplasmic reticulum ATPase